MKKFFATAIAAVIVAGCTFPVPKAHAISHAFRAKLERSGCTQVTEANGTCDPNKTKAQNRAASAKKVDKPWVSHPTTALDSTASEAQTVIGADIGHAADFLISKGWKANDGEWRKGSHILRLVVEGGNVLNAQLVK